MEKVVIIIPAFNERENVDNLVNSLEELAGSFDGVKFKVVFVDDGSHDSTGEYFLERVKKTSLPYKVIFLSRNFGKDSAVRTGLEKEEGDYYVIVDADGQTPLSYIPLMYKKLKETGAEVCSAYKRKEAYRFPRRFLSGMFFLLVKMLKIKELRGGYSDFKMFSRRVRDCVLSSEERDMVVRNYIEWMKFPETTIEFIPIKSPKTAFSFSRLFFLALKSIYYFSPVLLRFNFIVSLGFLIGGFIYAVAALLSEKLLSNNLFPCLFLFSFSLLFLALGIMGEYLNILYQEIKKRPYSNIKKIVDSEQKN